MSQIHDSTHTSTVGVKKSLQMPYACFWTGVCGENPDIDKKNIQTSDRKAFSLTGKWTNNLYGLYGHLKF